jgi:hypothetical protein
MGIPTPITTQGWIDAGANKSIGEGRIYLMKSEEFSFLLVPGGSIPWVQMEEDWAFVYDILTYAKQELSQCDVPKVTYFSGYSGPAVSDQVNFQKLDFWNRIRNFVDMALCSLDQG